MYKPFMSRTSNSEKYIIFKKFKYDPIKEKKQLKKQLDPLVNVFKKINSNKEYINSIFSDMVINKDLLNQFKYMNIMIRNNNYTHFLEFNRKR